MGGAEDRRMLRHRTHAGRPGQGLVAGAVEIGGAAEPLPAATGTRASKSARSAVVTMSRLLGQVISRRPGAVVAAQPLLTLAPDTSSLSRLSLNSGFGARR